MSLKRNRFWHSGRNKSVAITLVVVVMAEIIKMAGAIRMATIITIEMVTAITIIIEAGVKVEAVADPAAMTTTEITKIVMSELRKT